MSLYEAVLSPLASRRRDTQPTAAPNQQCCPRHADGHRARPRRRPGQWALLSPTPRQSKPPHALAHWRLHRPQRHARRQWPHRPMGLGRAAPRLLRHHQNQRRQPRLRRHPAAAPSTTASSGKTHLHPNSKRATSSSWLRQRQRRGQRKRAKFSGDADATETNNGEIVHSFGWYLKQYVAETRAQGATPIICSLTPRKAWSADGKQFKRDNGTHAAWAEQCKKKPKRSPFVPLRPHRHHNETPARKKWTASPSPRKDCTPAGMAAVINAECVISGLKASR